MSIETALYTQLSSHAGLSALVDNRIYPVLAPQNVALPFVAYFKVSNQREYTHQGYAGLSKVRMQISCYGDDYSDVKAVAIQVTAAMEVWPAAVTAVQAVFQDNETDIFEDGVMLYHIALDFFVWYASA